MLKESQTAAEEATQKLVPMMARGCVNDCTHDDAVFDHSVKDGTILVYWCERCQRYIMRKAG